MTWRGRMAIGALGGAVLLLGTQVLQFHSLGVTVAAVAGGAVVGAVIGLAAP